MKKIWIASALVPALLCAQNMTEESIETLLESKKVKTSKSTSWMPDISLIVDASYTHQSFDEDHHTEHLELLGLDYYWY